MGARFKVREIPSVWRQEIGSRGFDPRDYSLDIQRDRKGEFFELRVPTHLSDDARVTVDAQRAQAASPAAAGAQNGGQAADWIVSSAAMTNVNGSSRPCLAAPLRSVRRWMRSNRQACSRSTAREPSLVATNAIAARTGHFAAKANGSSCRSLRWWWMRSCLPQRTAPSRAQASLTWSNNLTARGGETVYVCRQRPNGLTPRRNTEPAARQA